MTFQRKDEIMKSDSTSVDRRFALRLYQTAVGVAQEARRRATSRRPTSRLLSRSSAFRESNLRCVLRKKWWDSESAFRVAI